jgi:hypothetical protein
MCLVSGATRAAMSTASRRPHTWSVRACGSAAVGLQAEPVLDRHEVEQAALGFGDQVHPVARGGQLAQPRLRLAPPGRMPAGAVKCDGEMHGL